MGADVMTQLLRISLIGGMTGDEMSAKVLSFSGGLGSEGALNFDQLAEVRKFSRVRLNGSAAYLADFITAMAALGLLKRGVLFWSLF